MTEHSSVPTNTKGQETGHGVRLRSAILPALTFLAGILTQSFIGHQQLLHAKRETRVAAMRDYASACYHDASSFSDLANLPLHIVNLGVQPGLSDKERAEKARQMEAELTERVHKTASDLAAQAEIGNALFQTQVDPVGVVMKDVPPEFNALPGEIDPKKLMERWKQEKNPIDALFKDAPLLGRQSNILSNYCRDSVQALSKEID